jgi:hypothetical protein
MKRSGLDKTKQFSVPWWFRTGLTANLPSSQAAPLSAGTAACRDAQLAGCSSSAAAQHAHGGRYARLLAPKRVRAKQLMSAQHT